MTAPRYVIAEQWLEPYDVDGLAQVKPITRTALVLPNAEHIHLTRHPDGTVTAVPMRVEHDSLCDVFDIPHIGSFECTCSPSWVDAPAGEHGQ